MKVEVEAKVVEGRFQEVLKDFQKQARLPGFREGKAPLDLVEKRYTNEAREELLKAYIPEVYYQSVQTQKVEPVCLPKISDIQYERGKSLSFNAEFEESPKVSLKNYKGIKLKRESADVTDKDMENGMNSLLDSRATYAPIAEKRAIAEGDFVLVDIELRQGDAYVQGRTGVLLSVKPSDEDDFHAKVVGASLGETREILRDGKPFTRVTLREIHERKVPELNADFAKVFGKDSVEDLKDAVRKDIASQKHAASVDVMKQELFEKLLSMTQFPLPESLVEKQKERLVEQARRRYAQAGYAEADWAEEKKSLDVEFDKKASEQVKLYFILQFVADEEKIELDEIAFEARLKGIAEQSQQPIDEVRRVFEDDLRESMLEKQTIDFLIANAKFDEEKK
jgi:trigger factor